MTIQTDKIQKNIEKTKNITVPLVVAKKHIHTKKGNTRNFGENNLTNYRKLI